ncbi:hypothetical protein K502DRAFT_227075 [Neoconidiobolus thromboides FSU 785]|nr:hypothetical protein K502DRAFT_227075 [Neoconidiobolus thromboides FSU 785]
MIEMRDEYIIELGNILGGYKIDLSKVKNDQTVYNSMLLETLKGFSCLKIDNFSFIKGYALLVSLAKPESDELNIEARRLSPIFIQTSPDKSKKKLFQGILEFLKPVPIDDVHNADEINYGSVRTFGMLFCAYSGLCENPSSVFDGDSNIMFCNLCDVVSSNNPHRNSKVKNTLSRKHLIDKELLKSFDWSVYLTYLDSRNASLIRELCMNSFYKIISHSPSIDLSKDIPVIINVCFNFLKDASHKVRHIANLILVKTVESENKAEIKEINYRIVFDKIEASFIDSSKFASRNILYSLIDELAFNAPEFILAKIIDLLIKLLMDANVIDAAMISNRIQNIERNKKTCLKEIFEPLWDYLVPTILIDLEKGRRAIKKLAHLMGFYVSDLAQIIHPFILPQIMLNCDTKSLDILCLVSAQGPNENTEVNLDSTEIARLRASICLANLDKILSILLLDLKNNDEPMSLFLQIVSEEDKPFSLAKAIKYCTDDLVENLVFELGSPDNIRKKEALDALSLVANALDESNGQNEAKSEVKDLLASKFMGFVSRFNIKLMNKTDNTINSIHLKMITGVDRVISIIDSRVDEYVTQIQAFLRTILRFRKHLTIALEVWKNYIFTLDERSLALVLNVAVVTLTEIYSKLSKKQKRIVIEILDDIFKRCSEDRSLNDLSFKKEDYLKCIGELSLLPENIEEFSKYNKKIKKLNSTKNIEELANLLISNTNHLNRVGRERALEKLYEFLCDNQDVISSWAIEVPTNTVIDNAIKQLMDIIHKHKEQDDEKTRYLVAKCFGAIGAIDPNCFEFKHTPKRKLMLFDPDSKDSCMKLAADLISSKLVELYHKSENYSVQISISYCLQELISLCSFDDPDMDSKEYNTDKTISPRLWFSFPQSTRETLQAFTRTRLSTWPSTAEKLVYPYYSPGLNFQTWVKSWTMDLIDYIEGEYSSQLFKPCYYSASSFIDISLFLLPYIILTLIVRNNINIKVGLSKEFNAILDIWEEADKFKDKKLDPQPIHLIINIIEGLSQIKMDMEIHLFEMYNGVYGDSLGMIKKSIEKDEAYSRLKNFIKDISPFKLAKAAINSNCYYEASKYLEQCIKIEEAKNNSNQKVLGDLNDDLHFVYSKINDEDSAKAIIDKLDTKTIEHKVRNYEAIKNWLAVETSYETLSRSNSTNLENQVGFTNCLQKLGYHGLTKNYIQEIIGKDPEREADSGLMRVLDECSWRVCSWGDPDKYLNDNTFDNVDKSLGQTLLSFKKNNGKGFDAVKLENTWMKMLPDFTITMDKSYTDGYESLMWAHMLYEVEDFNKSLGEAVNNEDQIDIIKNKAAKWDSRLKVVAPTYKAQEKILNLQRSLVTMYTSLPAPTTYNTQTVRASDKIKEALAINLVKSSKISRKGGYYQTSLISIHEFPESDNPLFIIEKAKWYRGQNDIHSAMRVLSNKLKTDNAEKEIDSKRSSRNGFVKDDKNISEIRLELIKYQIEANTESYVDILGELDKVIKSQPHWDKAHYISALYYLNQMEDELNGREENIKYDSLVLNLSNAAEHTLKCLMSSSKYIYQLLPRIITYWLDYCDTTSVKEYNKKYVDLVNKYLKGMAEKLKPYQFLPVLSQLISRVCVGCKDLYKILSAMIIKIFIAYPDQTLWGFFSSFLSEDKTRKALSIKIIDKSSQENSRVGEIYKEMLKFERFLLQLKKLSRSENLRPGAYKLQDVIPNFDTKYQFTSLLIPIESQLKFTLPNDMNTNYDNNLNFNPYNNNLITMNGFGSKLLVMPSMMRPIRFEIKGSDGNLYRFLCKPKDDLRKDARLMEFCNILNKMFYKNPESRMRHINIKTFTALPINNSVGLVEWVNDTECVKTIITSELNKIGIGGNDLYLTLKNVLDAKLATTRVKRIDKFENKAKPACPPVLINWFYRQFPNAEELYIARNKFAHSLAAMSIVGYIVGLGDRHGENLMVDTKSGQVMHVDFSCLFEQGLDLSVPELVPFRLTHNFEAILGPSGCEGAFRTTCEIVLQIMTDNKQILTSNLTTFLHDPLVDFNKIRQPADPSAINFIDAIRTERMRFLEEKSKKRPHPRLSEFAPVNSPIALWVLKRISYKLDGGYGTNIKLSRSGLVTRLIKEATDSENLFLMYIGWGSVY